MTIILAWSIYDFLELLKYSQIKNTNNYSIIYWERF